MNKLVISVLIGVIVIVGILFGLSIFSNSDNETNSIDENLTETSTVSDSDKEENKVIPNKLKAANFTGSIEEVNSGCFADGECFVVVESKHITVLRGWSSDIVGAVLGVESLGDLEGYVGEQVEVYAQDLSDGTYTLYGSPGFYIKTLTSGSIRAGLNEEVSIFNTKIIPLEVLEDSRCPIDVVCIHAGTVKLRAELTTDGKKENYFFALGEKVFTSSEEITLTQVSPDPTSEKDILETDYSFYFKVKNL